MVSVLLFIILKRKQKVIQRITIVYNFLGLHDKVNETRSNHYVVSFAAVISGGEALRDWEKRCVTTLITSAKETKHCVISIQQATD